MLVGPFPGMFEELLACEVGFLDALVFELLYHLGLGGNRGVVGTRHPKGVFALLAGASHQNILDCVVEHMAHVEYSGDVWRRDYDCVGLAGVGLGVEQAVGHPVVIPFVLDCARVVFCG